MKPQDFIGTKTIYDDYGQMIFGVDKKGEMQLLLNLRGWGAIQNLFKTQEEAMKFQDELGEFISDAINEKLTESSDSQLDH